MKKKILSLLILVIISTTCIFAFSGIGASADSSNESVKPYVISKNISYDSVVYCYYAVPKSSVPAGETPVLDVYGSDKTTISYTVTEYYEETVHGTPCYIFLTNGVPAKNLNLTEYVVPSSIGESGKTEGYGVEYSILHYLYERLYRNGFIEKTEADGKDYTRKLLYQYLMNYGASAQELLIPNQISSGKVKFIYGDYHYLTVKSGLNYGFVDEGYTVNIEPSTVPAPYGKELTGWNICTYDVRGNLIDEQQVGATYSLSASGIKIAEPIYTDISELDNKGTVKFDSMDSLTELGVTLGASGDATHQIIDGADVSRPGNNVLNTQKSSGAASVKIKMPNSSINKDAQKAVFSMDIMLTDMTKTGDIEIYFRKAGYDSQSYSPVLVLLSLSGLANGSEITYSDYTNGQRNNLKLNLGVQSGAWFNVTIEYYEGDADTFHFITYINGEMKYISNAIYGTRLYDSDGVLLDGYPPKAEEISIVSVNLNSSLHGNMYFDNMRLTHETGANYGDNHIEDLPSGQTLYNSSCNIMVVSESSTASVIAADTLVKALKSNITSGAFYGYEKESRTNEIIIGNVPSKPASVKAYEELSKLSSSSMFTESRYVIYADSGKIAFAFDPNTQTNIQSITYVVESFIENYVNGKSGILLGDGVIASGTIDLIEKQEELDAKRVALAWENLRVQCNNDELYEAFRTYYEMFENDKVVEWMANLYDPGFGCFYATTSGKNSTYIFPNVEATKQVLSLSSSLGMTTKIGDANAFTPLMEYQICYYVKSLQRENGYFYLPQLTKTQTDSAIARRARDLNWCVQLLSLYHVAPTYEVPITYGGLLEPDGKTADEFWADLVAAGLVTYDDKPIIWTVYPAESEEAIDDTAAYSVNSVVTLASFVLVSSDDGTAYLKSHAAFAEYIAQLNIDGDPYGDGNELGESQRQINEWSGKLGRATETGVWYSGMTLNEMIIHHLNSCINEKGLFGKKYMTDNNAATVGNEFVNTNGMMKIMAVYNGLGVAFPSEWAPIAAESLLNAVMRTDQVSKTNICEMYNIWCALSRLKSNVKNYNTDTAVRDNVLAQIENLLNTSGAAAVLNAYNTQKNYQKEDGTYAHRIQGLGSVTTHPGELLVGTGGEEGNIDAIGFGTCSTINMICDAFNLTPVPVYTEADWMRFLDIVMKLEPTGKTVDLEEMLAKEQFIDYESDKYTNLVITKPGTLEGNSIDVVSKKGKDGATSKVLQMTKAATGTGSNVSASFTYNKRTYCDVMVFETDMMFSSDSTGPVEVWLRRGDNNTASIHFTYLTFSSGNVYAHSNASTTKYKIAALGEWFTFRLEYRVTAKDASGTPTAIEIKLLVNGTAVYTETALYSGYNGDIPDVKQMTKASINLSSTMKGTCYLDNTTAVIDGTIGSGENAAPDNNTPEVSEYSASFDDMDVGTVIGKAATVSGALQVMHEQRTSGSSVVITQKPSGEGNAIKFSKTDTKTGDTLFFTPVNGGNECLVLDFDILFESNSCSVPLQINLGTSYRLQIQLYGNYLVIYDAKSNGSEKHFLGGYFLLGEWSNIRVEYYPGDKTQSGQYAKFYFNGELTAISQNSYSNTVSNTYTKASFYSLISSDASFYLDNVFAYSTNDKFTDTDKDIIRINHGDSEESDWENRFMLCESILGKDVTDELKKICDLFDDDVYVWLANLYDPTTGGFYYSNDARDYEGFLADVESTAQAISLISSVGLGNVNDIFTDEMKERLVLWVQSLQSDDDGYFYHPQWGRDIGTGRLSRDLGWSISLLNRFGASPLYPTALDRLASGSGSTAALTSSLTRSKEIAVSKVISVSVTTTSPQLASEEAFIAYLNNLFATVLTTAEDGTTVPNSYSIGNTVSSQASQIKAAGLADVCIAYFNAKQNPDTGLWEADKNYRTASGLLKISSLYNSLGAEIPNADKTVRSAIDIATSEQALTAIVYVYNPLAGLSNVLSNLKTYSTAENSEEIRQAVYAEMRSRAPELISNTYSKLSAFKKVDGSFSYNVSGAPSKSQGELVCFGANEGDVNGTALANGTINSLFSVIGVSKPNYYNSDDSEKFAQMLKDAKPVKKLSAKDIFVDFESVEPSTGLPKFVSASAVSEGASYSIVTDDVYGKESQVISLNSTHGKNDSVSVNFPKKLEGVSCYTFSGDIAFTPDKDNKATTIAQLQFGSAYMLNLVYDKSSGTIKLYDASSTGAGNKTTDLGISVKAGEWFNLRIEYYVGDADSVRIHVYLNGTLSAVSNNYYGKKIDGEPLPAPATTISRLYIQSLIAATVEIKLDNLRITAQDASAPKNTI